MNVKLTRKQKHYLDIMSIVGFSLIVVSRFVSFMDRHRQIQEMPEDKLNGE